MAEQGLDFLVAYADDRATFGPAHARWLANFPVHFEPACVLMPSYGAPVMLIGPESDEYPRLVGQIADVRVLREIAGPNEDYPYARIQPLAEIMAEMRQGAPHGEAGWLGQKRADRRRPDGGAAGCPARREWVDVEDALCDCRPEVARRDHGDPPRLQDRGSGVSGRRGCDPAGGDGPRGRRRDRGRDAGRSRRDGDRHHRGLRPQHPADPGADDLSPIGADDLVLLTIAPRYKGYHAAIGRMVLVGNPGAEIRTALDVAIRAQQACADALRPGIDATRSKPSAARSWPKGIWDNTSSIRAYTASASSSSSRRSSGRAARLR